MTAASVATSPARGHVELGDLCRAFGDELSLSPEHARVVRDIARCRTAALGGHVEACDGCGHEEISYNSCRNRHCPKCGGLEQARWVEARRAELLPVEYFHVVFTIPDVLHSLFLCNQKPAYGLLFAAVAETLKEVALNPARLGAKIGWTAVLHTWTQKLLYHPHLHCIVPGGGLSVDGLRWVSCKPGFLLPVRVLSTVFRGVLLSKLERALEAGNLEAPPGWCSTLLHAAAAKKWTVYAKRPFAGPEQVLTYVGRYTHRVALSNSRLVALVGREVTWRGGIAPTTTAQRRSRWTPPSSSADSCSMCCPRASCGSGTTASWRRRCGASPSRSAGACSMSPRRRMRRPLRARRGRSCSSA